MIPVDLARRIRIDFGVTGNSDEFAINGWSGAEVGHRWTTGTTSSIKLPPLGIPGDGLITFEAVPYLFPDKIAAQGLAIFFNESKVDEFELIEGRHRYSVFVPQALISSTNPNIVELRHPNAVRPRDIGGGNDSRQIAISFSSLSIEPEELRLLTHEVLLPDDKETPFGALSLESLAQRFQSLGQNCELGLFQRKCGTEPIGLFRFASIYLPQLLQGLERRFSDIGDLANINFSAEIGGEEYTGRDKLYGLDYHTFTKPGAVDLAAFAKSEGARLKYLARLLMDQIENAEKIFVIQRRIPNLTLREVIPLFRVLRSFNENIALLWVTEAKPSEASLIGRVKHHGLTLYHGYIDRLAPGENAHDLSFDCWVELCRTVVKATDTPIQVQSGRTYGD